MPRNPQRQGWIQIFADAKLVEAPILPLQGLTRRVDWRAMMSVRSNRFVLHTVTELSGGA